MEKKTHTYFYPETTPREKHLIFQNPGPEVVTNVQASRGKEAYKEKNAEIKVEKNDVKPASKARQLVETIGRVLFPKTSMAVDAAVAGKEHLPAAAAKAQVMLKEKAQVAPRAPVPVPATAPEEYKVDKIIPMPPRPKAPAPTPPKLVEAAKTAPAPAQRPPVAPDPAPAQKPTVTPAPAPAQAPGWRPSPNQIVQGVPYKADPLKPEMFPQAPAKAPAQAKGPTSAPPSSPAAPRPTPSAPAENPSDKLLNELLGSKEESVKKNLDAVFGAKNEGELEKALKDLQSNDFVSGVIGNRSDQFMQAFNEKLKGKNLKVKIAEENGRKVLVVDSAAPKPQESDEGKKLNFKEFKDIIKAIKEFLEWFFSKVREAKLEAGDIPTLESEIANLKKKEVDLKLKTDSKAKEELKQVTEQRVKLEARLKEMKAKYDETFRKIKPLTESQIVAFTAGQDKYGRPYLISKPGREAEALPQVRYVVRASYPEGVRPPVVQYVGRPIYLTVNVTNIGNVFKDIQGNVAVSGSNLQGASAEVSRPSAVRRPPGEGVRG